MFEVLKLLKDTPLPIVLVVGGIVLIGISFLRKVSTSLEPDPTSTGQARLFGLLLLVVGIGLYLIPSPQPISGLQQPASGDVSITSPPQPIGEYCHGKCWQYNDTARTMSWTGTKDGIEDIWQADGDPLQKIRTGYTAFFEISIPMKMEICMGSIDGKLISRQCQFQVIDIPAGKHKVVSAGPQGGFRVRLQ